MKKLIRAPRKIITMVTKEIRKRFKKDNYNDPFDDPFLIL